MIEINEAFVDSVAPNANAIKNGRALATKKKFASLRKAEDETLIFGDCKGSSIYQTSVDFITPGAPVYRCSCPSHQFPCKHALGLMYAWTQGQPFETADIPEDVLEKRNKILKKVEKKKTAAEKPGKVNKSALKKKITAQLEGLDILETLTLDLMRAGLGTLSLKTAYQLEEQARQMANAYLPGAQNAILRLVALLYESAHADAGDALPHTEALEHLTRLHALCRQGRIWLSARRDDPELSPVAADAGIASWLGHAWQLQELRETGGIRENVSLVQLAFIACDDRAGKRFVETGVWADSESGAIELTLNFRPYRAAGHIREEDAIFNRVDTKELFVYPGGLNPRIRWEEAIQTPLSAADCEQVRARAVPDFAPVIRQVKNQLKLPLSDKFPFALLRYARIGQVNEQWVIEDRTGERLVLADTQATPEPPTCRLLKFLSADMGGDQAMLVRFHHDPETLILRARPLSIVTDSEIRRLAF